MGESILYSAIFDEKSISRVENLAQGPFASRDPTFPEYTNNMDLRDHERQRYVQRLTRHLLHNVADLRPYTNVPDQCWDVHPKPKVSEAVTLPTALQARGPKSN